MLVCFLLLTFGTFFSRSQKESVQEVNKYPSFEVDYDNNVFLKDGKPFTYIAGEIHYFRIPKVYWRDRLRKVKAAGCNAISTYIEWSLHEPSPNKFDFTGELNLMEYLEIAKELDLLVILRPGPYICAERDFGGYPAWLLTVNPSMRLRTSDPSHTFFITRWFKELMPKIQPHLYGNGGNIIMVQVENEYGSYKVSDPNYLLWLRDLYQSYIGNSAVLFTTDGASLNLVTKGKIPGVLATIDFGPTGVSMDVMYEKLRQVQPKGPLVNSELYVGWISYWGKKLAATPIEPILNTIDALMASNASFSMYMMHGGTNFGFSSGSGSDEHFLADLTSYDYDAPISEAGDLTKKYEAIRNAILKNKNISSELDIEKESPKGDYGTIEVVSLGPLFESSLGYEYPSSVWPLTFESHGQRFGFISYSTKVLLPALDPSVLQVTVRDRAVVYLDDVEIGVLQYTVINELPLPPSFTTGQTLRLFVENMGRRNFMLLTDCTKGMVSNATLDGTILKDWNMMGYPLSSADIAKLDNVEPSQKNITYPAIFRGSFILDKGQQPLDTFLSLENWGKGVVFINEYNLGRYWHLGPQVTLYVPANYLRPYPANNTVVMVELHYANHERKVTFLPRPHFKDLPKSV